MLVIMMGSWNVNEVYVVSQRWVLHGGMRKKKRQMAPSLCACTQERLCERTVRRLPSASQGGGPHPEMDHASTQISGFQPPEMWVIKVCGLTPPGCGILLRKPKIRDPIPDRFSGHWVPLPQSSLPQPQFSRFHLDHFNLPSFHLEFLLVGS